MAGTQHLMQADRLTLQRRSWQWHLAQPPEVLWPVIADTARFNEAAKLPKYQVEDILQRDGRVLRLARATVAGMTLEWEELPYEWVRGRSFRQTRLFRKGPLRRFGPIVELKPEGGGTLLTYTLTGEPKGVLGALLFRLGFLEKGGAAIARLVKQATAYLAGARPLLFDYAPPSLPRGAAERVAAGVAQIASGAYGHGLESRLGEQLLTAQEVDLTRMRPLKLARDWAVEPRHVVELFLEATRIGLLRLSWDLLCPRCRGAKRSVAALDQLPKEAHCSACNIGYDADFARNVELSFQPSPSVRELTIGEYCLNGPFSTPHVVVQQVLAPGEERAVAASLPAGPYRLRTLEPGGELDIDHSEGAAFPEIVVADGRVTAGPPSSPGEIRLRNRGSAAAGIVIESREWVADALTAHRATLLQAFRDLLPGEALRPGEDIAIDNVTLMFTDLAGSTALYERIGDGPAYRLVRDHFAFLAGAVRQHNGTLVKTIGDAVMAAFSDPADAVRAALAVQDEVGAFNAAQGNDAITIKIGLHGGACIAVTMNDRLDYFGSTVNTAARLQGQSRGGDVVLSETLATDPAVAALLADRPRSAERAQLKGLAAAIVFERLHAG
ncbi:MAG TPA: adenylate/guanylate cyclase domain-containing protein [Stellaceae bacterium]|nr:adenylate/guanylate cyclase domain-containing protein [Stellaceae bacterium]